ncbi:MAG: FAD-dependent oxidoreductase, partial [Candidatus Dormibacteraeota bacterium]|nr:FAD-dependent oxidoreductase [Candidatus Dormibacteraeota bacterium]
PELLALNLESASRWPAFAAELEAASGMSLGYAQCGSLFVARDADDLAAIDRDHRFRERLGLDVQRLSGAACRERFPLLAPGIRGGVLARHDAQVDPRRVVDALRAACDAADVNEVAASPSLLIEHGAVAGVMVGGERINARAAVIAAGAWSPAVGGLPDHAKPPVRPVKGQIVRLRDPSDAASAHVIRGLDAYIVARDSGEVVVGATVEERGFDVTVTAGGVYEMLRDARELVPGIEELEVVEASAGLRPGTPDNGPCIGPTEVAGLFTATGHHRNGILLSPVTADAIVAMICGEQPRVDMAPFGLSRFALRSEVPV